MTKQQVHGKCLQLRTKETIISNHYYDKVTGEPRYTVETKTGGRRNTNVADAKKLGLVPSYSTIVSLLNKEGINIWNIDQIMTACMEWSYKTKPCATKEELEEHISTWKKDVKEIAGKLGRQGRERGTMVHDALEKCYKQELVDISLHELIFPVLELVDEHFPLPQNAWIAEKSFARNGYGGKVDLHTREGQGIIIDFKTKDVDDKKKMKPYPDDVMQHAAYRDGLDLPKALCYTLFVNVRHPGMLVMHEWKEEQVVKAGKMFNTLKQFWYLKNGMEFNYE